MNDEGVEIVEAALPKLAAATMVAESAKASPNNGSGDDDIVVEGVLNEMRLPHMRQHCTRFPINAIRLDKYGKMAFGVSKANSQSCDLCYCYVCDCPVKDCQHWYSPISRHPEDNHCCASDKNDIWKSMRSREKKRRDRAPSSGSDENEIGRVDGEPVDRYHAPWSACSTFEIYRENCEKRKLSTYGRNGPFKPDNPDAPLDKELTKCRHCSWYVRLQAYRTFPSSRDWCEHCGLVASEKDLEKQQVISSKKIGQNDESYFLDEKDIPFRIKAHDPRLLEKYKENWQDDDYRSHEWQYDDKERDQEVFLHRLGHSPNLENLVNSIPHVAKENIPMTLDTRSAYCSRLDDWKLQDATDAVIIEDPEQLQFVYLIASIGKKLKNFIKINASWNKESRSGVFNIRLSLPKVAFLEHNNNSSNIYFSEYIPVLLGVWYRLFPLRPSEISGLLKASSTEQILSGLERRYSHQQSFSIPIKPYRVELRNAITELREKLPPYIGSLRNAENINESRLTMAASNGSRFSGGVCTPPSTDTFRDCIVSYFSEQFVSLICNNQRHEDLVAFGAGSIRSNSFKILDAILGCQKAITSEACFVEDAWKCQRNLYSQSIEETMVSVENLGHESEDCVEGLKIELLDFQRQSLKWALEREQIPSGVQSFYWPKLPRRLEGLEDLYFNPILKMFRKDKPALVRGGFIAEQMGLGKTVISLALILKNQAPDFPLSGSPISALKTNGRKDDISNIHGWERNLYEKTSIVNKKTGSIISKGSLVICPVSLVGQWIDEARSKLKEPGLIYPYHGGNRKRDPITLSANSIVVTTYDVVASDAFHHAKKAGSNYCPPLQQIRWWRIIADEGHSLRESSTRRSKAVLSLVADHKWIVSGTPMNTSHLDLKNQLKFLGFEHVEKIFNEMHRNGGSRGKKVVDCELLMYFLRPIMMRHSQEQKYRGTSTTLMSLPPKTERKETVRFSVNEKKEFQKIEKIAQDWYINFRSANRSKISKYFLKISSKLLPLRIACSGGKCPTSLEKFNDEGNVAEEWEEKAVKKSLRETQAHSSFVFKSKFKTLLALLKKIRDKDPESKSLVFSQFSSTLDWLKVELPKHGFQFRTLTGDMSMTKRAKALSEFQNDPPTTIFLLSMRAGAVGINLTQANRVFLMEPSFNPALEEQAIGRIHRLGQKRPVEIVRLVVKNSLEERMVNFLEKKYGKYSKTNFENDKERNKIEKKQSSDKLKRCNGIVGNLKTDKVQLVTEEFDMLFGVKDRLLADDFTGDKGKADSEIEDDYTAGEMNFLGNGLCHRL